MEGWPPPPFRIAGRDEGRSAENFWLRPDNPGSAFRKAFERALRKCGIHAGRGPAVYRRQVTSSQRTVETVLPNARDRRIPALRSLLGHPPLFYRSELSERRPRPLRVPVVHLYLDVSGSMTACLPWRITHGTGGVSCMIQWMHHWRNIRPPFFLFLIILVASSK